MGEAEQALAYSEADFSIPHDAFVAHFQGRFPDFGQGSVIDLGCGPADVTVRFARACPEARILGVDGAEAMLALGRERIEQAGLTGRVQLERHHLPSPALASGFDGVISNSLLHHLDDPNVLWQTVRQVGKPGAQVLVMDLMRPGTPEELEYLAMTYAADAPPVLQRDFRCSLAAAYRVDEIVSQLAAAGLTDLQVEAVSDRHVLIWGRLDV